MAYIRSSSQDGTPNAEITKIVIADADKLADSWFKSEILASMGAISIEWIDPRENDDQSGIVSIEIATNQGKVLLD